MTSASTHFPRAFKTVNYCLISIDSIGVLECMINNSSDYYTNICMVAD